MIVTVISKGSGRLWIGDSGRRKERSRLRQEAKALKEEGDWAGTRQTARNGKNIGTMGII